MPARRCPGRSPGQPDEAPSWLEDQTDLLDEEEREWIGIPALRWDAPAAFAAANDMSTTAGKALLRDVLVLAHRMPAFWAAVRAGAVPAWRARRVAQALLGQPADVCRYVDTALTERLAEGAVIGPGRPRPAGRRGHAPPPRRAAGARAARGPGRPPRHHRPGVDQPHRHRRDGRAGGLGRPRRLPRTRSSRLPSAATTARHERLAGRSGLAALGLRRESSRAHGAPIAGSAGFARRKDRVASLPVTWPTTGVT